MTADETQAEVFALLSDPATYGAALDAHPGGRDVKRIDTHAAAVFLAGARAYKVKRAVRYPFLDFSTLEQRKAACEAELAVNRPFAPQLYRRVVPIARDRAGRLALDGAGTPVEWAIEMERFDDSATLDHVAARGGIDLALADALARAIAEAHAKAPIADARPWPERLSVTVAQNHDELCGHADLFDPARVDALTQASNAALRGLAPLLASRGAAGLVRHAHGDLHLGNIVLIEGKPVIFDAIEFDPKMATGDLLYDLAFTLMDLIERGLDAASNVVLNRYLVDAGRAEDLDGLAALPLFLSVRAAIRAKVTAAKRDVSATDHAAVAAAARTYFDLAVRLIAPPAPVLIAVGGHSGTGKSVLARALAPLLPPAPGAVVLRSDVERKRMFGAGETERLPPAAYRPWETERVYTALVRKARRVIAAGHSAVIDAVCGTPDEREQIAAAAKATNTPFLGLFLAADLAVRVARVEARKHDASDATADVVRRQDSYEVGDVDWAKIDAGGTPEQTLRAAKAALASHAPGSVAPR
jgi:aminoglycoside phosphotransferase family enzyme/predicted kinase